MGLVSFICNLLPVRRDKIVFYSFTETYGDQPRYVAEELLRRGVNAQLVWVSEAGRVHVPAPIRSFAGKLCQRFHFSTARVIVCNARIGKYFEKGFLKKPGQAYIQTWHGSFGIKKMEANVHKPKASYIRRAKLDSRHIDYLVSNCRWLTELYRACFFYCPARILEIGSPRNDILLYPPAGLAESVRRRLGVPEGVKTALYAPTFRERKETSFEALDFTRLHDALAARFGGEWRILVRLHPGMHGKKMCWLLEQQSPNCQVADVSDYPDTSELLLAADAMVSDYSSCIFDYLLTGKPAFLYAPDEEEYEAERGLYYPLADTPFPLAASNAALAQAVEQFDEAAYAQRVASFLAKQGSVEDGHAASRLADIIVSLMNDPK